MLRWATPLLLLLLLCCCTGCFGARISAGPIFDSRGNVGADAVLLISYEVPVGDKTAIELAGGGGGGVASMANNGVSPIGSVQAGVGVMHMDERFGLRANALGTFQGAQSQTLSGFGGAIGMPILVSSSSERLFGSEEKGFGRSKSFTCLGPELDILYTRSRPRDEDPVNGLSISPRFVAEIHGWTLF